MTLGGAAREGFWTRAGELVCDNPAIKELRSRTAAWVRPEMRVRVRHLKGGDMLRHATVRAVNR